MTKTIYSLTPAKNGDYTQSLVRMIGNHNEGNVVISFEIIINWLHGEYAQWQSIRKIPSYKYDHENGIMEIFEGEQQVLTIYEKIVSILEPINTIQGEA